MQDGDAKLGQVEAWRRDIIVPTRVVVSAVFSVKATI